MAHLEEDAQTGQKELRLLFLSPDHENQAIVYLGDWDVYHALALANANSAFMGESIGLKKEDVPTFKADSALLAAINLLIYINSYTDEDREYSVAPSYPTPTKTKSGWRLFPPNAPKIHIMGQTFGEQIRAAREKCGVRQNGNHASPSPHIRRAHWHGFWSGSKKEEGKNRKLAVRWLPPIAVAMKDDTD